LSDQRTESVRLTTIAGVSVTVILAAIAAIVLVIFIRADLRALSERYEGALATSKRAAMTKDRLLAMVSHELRTPLTSILGWATLLRGETADPETTRLALSSIEQSARLQSRLIEDLIDVSRAAAGKLRVKLEEIDLREVLRAALETMKPAANAKRVTISASIPETESTVMGDAERLQQVFWNLLSNAVRFTPAGGTIQLAASSDNGSEVVRVRDSGTGIDPEFLPHVFEPFSQEHEAAQQSMGLGLGLAIARRLVEMHGGTIEAKSDGPGRGAEFIVRLPHFTARTSVIQ
jgi:signal transduction histidine kinase